MIISIAKSPRARGSLNYNFEKTQSYERVVAKAIVLGGNVNLYGDHSIAKREMQISSRVHDNRNTQLRYSHVKVSLSSFENVSNKIFNAIGKDTLEGLGYSLEKNSHIIFRHFDSAQPHIHIIVSRVDCHGKLTSDSHDFYAARDLARELEKKYNLVSAFDKNLNHEKIRGSKFYETKRQKSEGRQSARQQVRDVITEALENNDTFVGFANELQGSNVEIRFRVEKKDNGKTMVGLSYGLMGAKEKALDIAPKLSLNLPVENSDEIISQLVQNGYAKEAENKFYFDAGNGIRSNQNPYPVEPIKDYAFRGGDIGPGAEWYSLSEKFDDCNLDLVKDLLVEDRLQEKKSNVWIVKCEDVFPKLDSLELVASLGLKQNNLGYLYEAVKEGFDFDALYDKHENRDHTLFERIDEIGLNNLKDIDSFKEGYLQSMPLVQERLKAVSALDLPEEMAIAYALEEVSERTYEVISILRDKAPKQDEVLEEAVNEIALSDPLKLSEAELNTVIEIEDSIQKENEENEILDRDLWVQSLINQEDALKFSRELVLEPVGSTEHEEVKETGKSLLDYFLEANEEELRKAALNPKVDFMEIKKYLDEEYYFKQQNIAEIILEIAEKRIAKDLARAFESKSKPSFDVVKQAINDGKVSELRYWVHMDEVNFDGQIAHFPKKVIDSRVLEKVSKRIKADKKRTQKDEAKNEEISSEELRENKPQVNQRYNPSLELRPPWDQDPRRW
jgi:hypothetical protein